MRSAALLYHKIDHPTADVKIRGAYTNPRKFARQMAYLKRAGYDFLLASEYFQHRADTGKFPENTICVTFDDGWKDTYREAFPILRGSSIKATVYLVPSCIGQVTDRVTADGEGPREHMSETDIREMSAAGIEFGSHSMSHALLDRTDRSLLAQEIVGSKAAVEDLIQKPCATFSYPAGYFDAGVQQLVREAGYLGAFSTCHGPDAVSDIFAINRCEILRRHGRPFQYSRALRQFFKSY